jgi:hypothetical protein
MAKTEAQRRREVMREEWNVLKSTNNSISELVGLGVLHNQALSGWRAP